ncbi:hypothetical protein ODJ79_38595 [Actinoplanes sp. KI2]|uniref:hypothetical protein n=1 Tax=Actinoplanes sp. KI2 TaxID=2983315 RepID=UPI0021D59911|nr:hypothetical protein [Actinoplanes sp. KI2]MCU7729661.1 hypothetical protein [Actinoplanes sp. KI2]
MLTISLTDRFHPPAGISGAIAESGGRGFVNVKIGYDREGLFDGLEAGTGARRYDAGIVSAGEIA